MGPHHDNGGLFHSFGAKFLFIKTHFYGGALTSHFMGEQSPPASIFPILVRYSDPVIWATVGPVGVPATRHSCPILNW